MHYDIYDKSSCIPRRRINVEYTSVMNRGLTILSCQKYTRNTRNTYFETELS